MQNTWSKTIRSAPLVNQTFNLKEISINIKTRSRSEENHFESRHSRPTFVYSFDKLTNSNHASIFFDPTLSMLMLPRLSSNDSTSIQKHRLKGDYKDANNVDYDVNRRLFSIARHDPEIQNSTTFLSMLTKLLVATSILMMVAGIWIEYLTPETFTSLVLRIGTYPVLPLHYLLVINAVFGFLYCTSFALALFSHNRGISKQIIYTVMVCFMWATFTVIYNFGANILYEAQLEVIMANEMITHGEESLYWKRSQNFFKCCGINSPESWGWNRTRYNTTDSGTQSFPPSCCDPSLSLKSCEGRPNNAQVLRVGCLDLETDLLLGIGYALYFISTTHFLLLIFAAMSIVKIYFRTRYLRSHIYVDVVSRSSSQESTLNDNDTNELVQPEISTNKFHGNDKFEIKKSSTL